MPSGYDQAQKRRLQPWIFNIIGVDMPLYMMYANQRLLSRIGDGFCLCHPHKQGPHKARPISDSNCVHIRQPHLRCRQSLFNYLIDFLDMLSGCKLWHYPAIKRMQRNLG
jgi:hypothetical protein